MPALAGASRLRPALSSKAPSQPIDFSSPSAGMISVTCWFMVTALSGACRWMSAMRWMLGGFGGTTWDLVPPGELRIESIGVTAGEPVPRIRDHFHHVPIRLGRHRGRHSQLPLRHRGHLDR
ncbi:hypothetical protein ABZW11_18100 [Nonomuraea sp. NPDC004580]|uniref:hypothetical protein n=1 Tax=Nonomuraea sp. NPDC004580 TaxID=3154552 RepID=UPI0033B77AFD